MPQRLDSIAEDETEVVEQLPQRQPPARGVRLSDVSDSPYNPAAIESQANGVFARAEQQQIPLTLAQYKTQQEVIGENYRRNLWELKKAGFDVKAPFRTVEEMPQLVAAPEISFIEGVEETRKAVRRGAINLAKAPGILLQAYGESAPTPEEREAQLQYSEQQAGKKYPVSRALDKAANFVTQNAKRMGDNCVIFYNGLSQKQPMSDEMKWALEQPFGDNPFARTAVSVGESAPSYGAAVATVLLTKNPNLGLAVLGTSSATGAYEGLRSEGVDPDLAMGGAALIGSIEVLTEKVPMDILLKGTGKTLLRRAALSGTAESFQELFTGMGQNYVTAVVKDVEDEGLVTAAQQEWSTIINGWQDMMASGLVMGSGAAIFTNPGERPPRETIVTNMEQIRKQVQDIAPPEEVAPVEKPAEKPPAEKPPEEAPKKPTVYKLAESVEARAIEAGLIESFGDLPEGETINLKKQAEKAFDFISKEPEKAWRVANHLEAAPAGLFPENVFKAMETIALMKGDAQMLRDLAFSPEALRVSRILGQRIVSLRGDANNPIKVMRDVSELRKDVTRRRKKRVATDEELQGLQDRLSAAESKLAEYASRSKKKPTKAKYGSQNTLVKTDEYTAIIERRKNMPPLPGKGKQKGAAYVPTPSDFADMAKIGLYHIEAMGRNFAEWSKMMVSDLGDWVKPHLEVEYEKAIQSAHDQGVKLPEDKKLESYKKRLRTMTAKKEAMFIEGELDKPVRGKIVLDAEGKKLKRAYEAARDKLKAARDTAGVITEKEAQDLTDLARITQTNKEVMLEGPRRTSPGRPTDAELNYGVSQVLYNRYVAELKALATKRNLSEFIIEYLKNPLKIISDIAGAARTICASLDDSFIGRQGLKMFYKGLALDPQSAIIWADTFVKSFQTIWRTFKGKDVMLSLEAMIISDPEYDLIMRTKADIATTEEEVPSGVPGKIPILGITFKAGENAYTYSAHYMRYRVAKMYLDIWRNAGRDMNSRQELENIGTLTNSLTGRGDIGTRRKDPGIINNLFWSPRNLKADIDFITMHMFDKNMSFFAKRQAATNLLRYVAGTAAILAIAGLFDDESVTWNPTNADFGKIRFGNTRFSVGGSMSVLIVLASRLISQETTSSVTGEKKAINTNQFNSRTGKDLVYNFLENKASPAASVGKELLERRTRENKEITTAGVFKKLFTPLSVQNYFETQKAEDSADVLSVMIAEFLGVNVQTYGGYMYTPSKETKKQPKRRSIFD